MPIYILDDVAGISSNELLGWLIGALVVLVGLAVSIITPIIKLNKTITKLDISVSNLAKSLERDESRIEQIEKTMQMHNEYLLIDKKRLDNHEERLKDLDRKTGIFDDDDRGLK